METKLLEEYKDASANTRHYANHCVAFLSLFVAFTGGLSVVFRESESSTALLQPIDVKWVGFIGTFSFWVMTESAHYLWGLCCSCAAAVGQELHFMLYSKMDKMRLRRYPIRVVPWGMRLLFVVVMFFWNPFVRHCYVIAVDFGVAAVVILSAVFLEFLAKNRRWTRVARD